jgi:adenine deaminase
MRGILLAAFFLMGPSAAQDLILSNARVIDGTGAVIEPATLTVQGGEIVSIDLEGAAESQATQLNANGMTVMPGMIDTHVHLSASPDMYRSARAFLELGFTTIADNAGHIGMVSELRDQIATQNSGPRILIFRRPGRSRQPPCKHGLPPHCGNSL